MWLRSEKNSYLLIKWIQHLDLEKYLYKIHPNSIIKKKKISNLNSDSNNSTNPIHEAYVIKGEKQRRKGQSQVHPRLIQGEKDKQAISPSTRKSSSAGFTAPLSSPPSTRFDRAKKWKGRLVAWCHAPWHYLPGLLYRYLVARAGPGNSCSRGEHRRWMNKVRGTPCCRRVPPAFKMWIPRSFLCLAVALHLEERQISLRKYSDPNDHFTLSTNLFTRRVEFFVQIESYENRLFLIFQEKLIMGINLDFSVCEF